MQVHVIELEGARKVAEPSHSYASMMFLHRHGQVSKQTIFGWV
jgi:hypothetical protein